MSTGRVIETTLRIAVPPGAVGGTEFVFRRMGSAAGQGSAPGDVIVVLREAEHPSLVRHGDDLCHVHCREARAHELLLRLQVNARVPPPRPVRSPACCHRTSSCATCSSMLPSHRL